MQKLIYEQNKTKYIKLRELTMIGGTIAEDQIVLTAAIKTKNIANVEAFCQNKDPQYIKNLLITELPGRSHILFENSFYYTIENDIFKYLLNFIDNNIDEMRDLNKYTLLVYFIDRLAPLSYIKIIKVSDQLDIRCTKRDDDLTKIQYLLDRNANLFNKNASRYDCIMLALISGNHQLIELVRKRYDNDKRKNNENENKDDSEKYQLADILFKIYDGNNLNGENDIIDIGDLDNLKHHINNFDNLYPIIIHQMRQIANISHNYAVIDRMNNASYNNTNRLFVEKYCDNYMTANSKKIVYEPLWMYNAAQTFKYIQSLYDSVKDRIILDTDPELPALQAASYFEQVTYQGKQWIKKPNIDRIFGAMHLTKFQGDVITVKVPIKLIVPKKIGLTSLKVAIKYYIDSQRSWNPIEIYFMDLFTLSELIPAKSKSCGLAIIVERFGFLDTVDTNCHIDENGDVYIIDTETMKNFFVQGDSDKKHKLYEKVYKINFYDYRKDVQLFEIKC